MFLSGATSLRGVVWRSLSPTILRKHKVKSFFAAISGAMLALVLGISPAAAERVTITGEVIDSWCYLTEIMYPLGTAHTRSSISATPHAPIPARRR